MQYNIDINNSIKYASYYERKYYTPHANCKPRPRVLTRRVCNNIFIKCMQLLLQTYRHHLILIVI